MALDPQFQNTSPTETVLHLGWNVLESVEYIETESEALEPGRPRSKSVTYQLGELGQAT